jgi:ABC-type Co2+ transport system permease subunit
MSDGTLLAYIALLVVSGVLLLVLGAGGFGQTVGARVISALFGAAFVGYAVYLLFFFNGDKVRIFAYAFLAPIVAVVNVVKARKAKRQAVADAGSVSAQPYEQQAGQPDAAAYGRRPGDVPQAVPPTS